MKAKSSRDALTACAVEAEAAREAGDWALLDCKHIGGGGGGWGEGILFVNPYNKEDAGLQHTRGQYSKAYGLCSVRV